MISRFEFLYIKEKIKKIENILFEYEMKSEVYRAWDRYIHLTAQEKEEIENKWNNYYQNCKNSFWGKAFFYLKEKFFSFVLIKKTIDILRDLANKRNIKPLPKPDSIDPFELKTKINSYYRLKSELNGLKKIYEEYSGVYERGADNSLD